MSTSTASPTPRNRRYMAAVVLGTALSALGASPALGAKTQTLHPEVVADISRYCTVCWRNARLPDDSWGDCTQDVLSRLIQTLQPGQFDRVFQLETSERQEFLRAIDAVKKRTQRRLKRYRPMPEVIADRTDAVRRDHSEEMEVVARAAVEVLTERQQRILRMSMEGWAVHDIAAELAMTPERVSDEKYKAVRKLREHLSEANG